VGEWHNEHSPQRAVSAKGKYQLAVEVVVRHPRVRDVRAEQNQCVCPSGASFWLRSFLICWTRLVVVGFRRALVAELFDSTERSPAKLQKRQPCRKQPHTSL
jgi:hypothetical protein